MLADVRRSGAHLLFVGIPTPRKERFLIEHARPAGVPFSVGVGGSFDVLAGLVRCAPHWMQAHGLEWLFRLAQEPGRLWRRNLTTNTRFMLLVGRELIRVRVAARRSTGSSGPQDPDRTT